MQKTPVIPYDYASWHHCITVECGIALTAAFIGERIRILSNPKEYEHQRFAELYGEDHLHAVVNWFQQAGKQIHAKGLLTAHVRQ